MARLFLVLACLNTLALVATIVVGCLSKFVDSNQWYVPHFTIGLYTSIGTLMVHCIVFVYFLGTGRWVKEVAIAYRLPDEPYPKRTRELKRSSFPKALSAMLITIAAAAAGQGAGMGEWPWWVHGASAVIAFAVNLWAFVMEYADVRANGKVLDGVLVEVDRIRAERGLPSNAEALRQEEQMR